MLNPQSIPPLVYTTLGWIGGAASTVAGSWLASKIHVYHEHRDKHRDAVKEKVLAPLYSCLKERFTPLVRLSEPAVSAEWKRQFFAAAAPAMNVQEKFDLAFEPVNPWEEFKTTVDRALYHDAKIRHFAGLITSAESLASAWERYAHELQHWIQDMSNQLSKATDIPPMKNGAANGPFVDAGFLGSFVYKRLCGIPVGSLSRRAAMQNLAELHCERTNVAIAAPDSLENLVAAVDALIEGQRETGQSFVSRANDLAKKLDKLDDTVSAALASAKLPTRCDFVPFF